MKFINTTGHEFKVLRDRYLHHTNFLVNRYSSSSLGKSHAEPLQPFFILIELQFLTSRKKSCNALRVSLRSSSSCLSRSVLFLVAAPPGFRALSRELDRARNPAAALVLLAAG